MKSLFSGSAHLLRCLLPGLLLAAAWVPSARADDTMRSVQEELRKRNLYFGEVDGMPSPQVAAALRPLPAAQGLCGDGPGRRHHLALPQPRSPRPRRRPGALAHPERHPRPTVAATTTTLPPSVSPWPNLPVLHSDEARVNPTPPDADPTAPDDEPTPRPVPKPPPAAAFQRWPDSAALHGFVENFVRLGESNAPGAQTTFFADRVDYFNEGTVSRDFIDKDTERYNKRWPDRHFTLLDPLTVGKSPDRDPSKIVVNFRCRIDVQRPGPRRAGRDGEHLHPRAHRARPCASPPSRRRGCGINDPRLRECGLRKTRHGVQNEAAPPPRYPSDPSMFGPALAPPSFLSFDS